MNSPNMKTTRPIEYHAAPYGRITTIPAGVTVTPATNRPATEPTQYWAGTWQGMTVAELSWQRDYGFLLTLIGDDLSSTTIPPDCQAEYLDGQPALDAWAQHRADYDCPDAARGARGLGTHGVGGFSAPAEIKLPGQSAPLVASQARQTTNTMSKSTDTEQIPHGLCNAQAWTESAVDMIARLNAADDDGLREAVETEIQESPLEICWRSGWSTRHDVYETAEAYILLSTGGPALRLIVDVTDMESARLEWQDWGTPWTDCHLTSDEEAAWLRFASIVGVECL